MGRQMNISFMKFVLNTKPIFNKEKDICCQDKKIL